ncbi:MAG: preprotein translocase subunit SecD [Methanomicrobiales archaeon]|nr:preprotein translocase subunit SecD [Methanomicrobiales archaeon]
MKRENMIAILKDWRVALLIILVLGSIIAIYPHFENGKLETNLQYGLELQSGTSLQLEFKAAVVGFQTTRSVDAFIQDVRNATDAEVYQIEPNRMEVRALIPRDDLARICTENGGTLTSYEQGVSQTTGEEIKRILENKVNALGTQGARVTTLTSLSGVTNYVIVELAGTSLQEAQAIVGKQGRFEIRIVVAGNQTQHVLYGDAITSVGVPSTGPANQVWAVPFTLSDEGAVAFREACIATGAVTNPKDHELMMILDNLTVYSAPLSPDLATELQNNVVRQLSASTGSGDAGLTAARNLEIHLRAGALPVDVIAGSSWFIPAPLSEKFKTMSILAGVFALLAVGLVIYYRYREPGIVLPMVFINASEIIILLGISRFILQLDLASIAGLIAVLGTGIDQLVIITDEILHEGKVPSPNLYLKRLSRALTIIVASAATVFIAMVPLALMPLSTLRGFAIITILGVLVGIGITRPAYGRIIMQILSLNPPAADEAKGRKKK